jgi:hypothetical protein
MSTLLSERLSYQPLQLHFTPCFSSIFSLRVSFHLLSSFTSQLHDFSDVSVFSAALETKNLEIAQAIKNRDANAIEETNSAGMTFLHRALSNRERETCEFLFRLNVNVNSKVCTCSPPFFY